ncbi:neuromedin-S [Lampris incognitus]|uniref:neuromedin-S n=1 Tax=Lampris incognitus TaxID=2546036 RepID=UPI0024B4DB71|nr:neuromedin-S [Lampris incognitus]
MLLKSRTRWIGSHTELLLTRRRVDQEEKSQWKLEMTTPTARQLCLLHLFWCLGCWSASAESYARPSNQWENGISIRKLPGVQRSDDMGNMVWADQNEGQVQNIFKRFLFHYSKGHNSIGTVQHESHSVHPLMRLFPKLSQRRKKLVLLKIRALPVAML